jgi:hypothetical protein
MIALKTRIVVFGTKGVFEVIARQDVFRPQDLSVRRITETPPLFYRLTKDVSEGIDSVESQAYVKVGESIFYFSSDGVSVLTLDQNSLTMTSSIITDKSIKTLYNNIPPLSRALSKGVFVPEDNTVRWLYKQDSPSETNTTEGDLAKDAELIYDITLNAWYKNTYETSDDPSDTPGLVDYYIVDFDKVTNTQLPSETVRWIACGDVQGRTGAALLNIQPTTFTDFSSVTAGFEETSFIQTGYINLGDTQRQKQSSYIVPSFLRTEDGFTDDGNGNLTPTNESSCMISAYWDYADDDVSGKINDPFEAYRYNRLYIPADASDTFDYGQSVITTKNRLTGRGRALSLRFESSTGKDCKLLGWGMDLETNRRV